MKEEGKKSQREVPSLSQIDLKRFQDALRALVQPIESDDPRLDFYEMYQKEATEYDKGFIEKHHEELNATLIFAGLFTSVVSVFVIYIQTKLERDPAERSAALLLDTLLATNPSAEVDKDLYPPNLSLPAVAVAVVIYASLLLSLVAAFAAMWGKRWLCIDSSSEGRTMIKQCGYRQCKRDEFSGWRFSFYIRAPPFLLYLAITGLLSAVIIIVQSTNEVVWWAIFPYLCFAAGILAVSTLATNGSSLKSIVVRFLWYNVVPRITAPFRWMVTTGMHRARGPPLPTVQETLLELAPLPPPQPAAGPETQTIPDAPTILDDPVTPGSSPWMEPGTRVALQWTNAIDARCVSWILWNITSRESLDVAIRLASMVRWFKEGLNVVPPYELIVSTLEACFDPSGQLRPRSRDRACYSTQAIMWIHIRAMCVSEKFADKFPLPAIYRNSILPDYDLQELLEICELEDTPHLLCRMYHIPPGFSPKYLQWTSDALLHLAWAKRSVPGVFDVIEGYKGATEGYRGAIPLNSVLDLILVSCILLGGSVETEALEIQDKCRHSKAIASKISKAIVAAIRTSHPRLSLLPRILRDVTKWDDRPSSLVAMAYEWCSVIEECRNSSADDQLLLLTLEIGFRNIDPGSPRIDVKLVHTEHHQNLADIVFESADDEAIADLLHAWTSTSDSHEPPPWLKTCARHLVDLRSSSPRHLIDLWSYSPRLRRLVIRSVGLIGYGEFEQVGVEGFVQLLDDLRVGVEDMDATTDWTLLLLDVVKSPEGARHLSRPYWELLAEVVALESPWAQSRAYTPETTTSLGEAEEWEKLESWIGAAWMLWPPGVGEAMEKPESATEVEMERAMALLSRNAVQNIDQRVGRWSKERRQGMPESFQRICKQAHEAAERDGRSTLLANEGVEEPPHPPLPAPLR